MICYKYIGVGFYEFEGKYYFAFTYGNNVRSYSVSDGEISLNVSDGPGSEVKVKRIFSEDWEDNGLSRIMIERRFPNFDTMQLR